MEKEKLYDKWTATGLETIKACVEDKIANYCELNKKQCQEVLNLIEKQQKEIEELKHDNSILCEIAYTGKRIQPPYTMVYTGTDNFISKDKIKEKIKELESHIWKDGYMTKFDKYAIHYLEELLGE